MANPLLRGLVDLLRSSVHGLPSSCVSSHRDHASGSPDLATISNAATALSSTGVTECAALQGPALFRLNVCRANDLAPLVDTFGDELAEISGAHRHRHATEIGEPRLDLGIGKSSIDLLVEFLDDFRGCILWRADAAP